MSENYIVINGMKADLTREQLKQLRINEESNRRWRAEKGKLYWFTKLDLNYGYIVRCGTEKDFPIDNIRYNTHNYFQTETETQKYADVLNTEMKLRKYADEHNGEFNGGYRRLHGFISAGGKTEMGSIWVQDNEFIPRCIKFSDIDVIDGAVKEIGIEKIIEYLTYEW